MKKRILIILEKADLERIKTSNRPILGWINDCKINYDFDYWGKDFSDISLFGLKAKINEFKPNFIYLTQRKRYYVSEWLPDFSPMTQRKISEKWLPDLTSIKNVPKIYVEVDNCYYNVDDSWYKQFDKVYCREPSWNGWDKIPLFRWSVPEIAFPTKKIKRSGIYFIGKIYGHATYNPYSMRQKLKSIFSDRIKFIIRHNSYWKYLKKASALLCPTEHYFGNYTPNKLLEFLASGAAVITNCDFNQAGIPELEEFAIKYSSIRTLKHRLGRDFTPYHDKAVESMKNHTHRVRYKELFG